MPTPKQAPIPTPAASYRDFKADPIILSFDDSGAPTYKVKGIPFAGQVRALMGEHGPRKVIGLAPSQAEPHPF